MDTSSDSVNFLVHLSTMMVTLLTGTGHSERYTGRMPRSNTGDFPQTFVRLTGQFLGMPPGCYTFKKNKV